MKINRHGKYFERIFLGRCPICECEFEFTKDDKIFFSHEPNETGEYELKLSIGCPECGAIVSKDPWPTNERNTANTDLP